MNVEKNNFLRKLFIVFVISFFPRILFAAEPVFNITAARDIPLSVAGLAVLGGGTAANKFLPYPDWDGTERDISSVPVPDRYFAQPYSKTLDVAATALVWTMGAAPFALSFLPAADWKTVCVMYAETLMYSQGLKEALKSVVHRYRPYTYYGDPDTSSATSGDYVKSWPSGHTSTAFASAVFASYVYCTYYPDSEYKFAFTGGCLLGAAGIGVMRMMSGNHFLTDVVSGAILGSVTGFLIPFMHRTNLKRKSTSPVSLMVYPSGIGMHIDF